VKCDYCDEEIEFLPFKCKYCGDYHCKVHRLPEKHECAFSLTQKTRFQPKISRPLTHARNQYVSRTRNRTLFKSGIAGYQIILLISFIMFFIAFNFPDYFYLSLDTLFYPYFYFHTILTAMFIPTFSGGSIYLVFDMILYVVLMFFLGRNIEGRFGRNIFLKIYFIGSLITTASIIIFSLLGSTTSFIYRLLTYSTSQGGIMALIAFIARYNPEREINLILYFIPIRLKMKHLLWIYIGFQFLDIILYLNYIDLIFIIIIDPLSTILGLFGGILVLKSLRGPRQIYRP
jgi:hypothetical protein